MAGVENWDDDLCPEPEESASSYIWQYFSVTNSSNAKEAAWKPEVEPRMQLANFVTEPSVDAALQEQQHTFWDAPSWGNPKQEYKHVL
jgi:hypothetical protein